MKSSGLKDSFEMRRTRVGAGIPWRSVESVILCPSFRHGLESFCFCQCSTKRATFLGCLSLPPSPRTIPFTLSREQQPSREMLDNTSVSVALLPYPFEIQRKPINSTLLLVAAACMVWILSIRKTVNPAHLFTLTSSRHPACPYKYWKLVTCLLDHEKMEAYGRIHM